MKLHVGRLTISDILLETHFCPKLKSSKDFLLHVVRLSVDFNKTFFCVLIFWQPNNILLMTEHAYPEIKIIDFGLARQIKDGEQICLIVGTPEYVGKCYVCILSHTTHLS